MIKGIHHISMKCGTAEVLAKVREFYIELLGLKIKVDISFFKIRSDGFPEHHNQCLLVMMFAVMVALSFKIRLEFALCKKLCGFVGTACDSWHFL